MPIKFTEMVASDLPQFTDDRFPTPISTLT